MTEMLPHATRGTLEVALKAYIHLRHKHCTDEAQKAETILSAVIYTILSAVIYIYIYI